MPEQSTPRTEAVDNDRRRLLGRSLLWLAAIVTVPALAACGEGDNGEEEGGETEGG